MFQFRSQVLDMLLSGFDVVGSFACRCAIEFLSVAFRRSRSAAVSVDGRHRRQPATHTKEMKPAGGAFQTWSNFSTLDWQQILVLHLFLLTTYWLDQNLSMTRLDFFFFLLFLFLTRYYSSGIFYASDFVKKKNEERGKKHISGQITIVRQHS